MHSVHDASHTEQRCFAFPIPATDSIPRPFYISPDGIRLAGVLPCLHVPLQAQRQPQPLIDFVHERLISLTQDTQHERLMEQR
jgi:hypothetical protein